MPAPQLVHAPEQCHPVFQLRKLKPNRARELQVHTWHDVRDLAAKVGMLQRTERAYSRQDRQERLL